MKSRRALVCWSWEVHGGFKFSLTRELLSRSQNGKTAFDVAGWGSKDDGGVLQAKALLEAAMLAGIQENAQQSRPAPAPMSLAENRRLLRHAFSCLLFETSESPRTGRAVVQGVMNVLNR